MAERDAKEKAADKLDEFKAKANAKEKELRNNLKDGKEMAEDKADEYKKKADAKAAELKNKVKH